METFVHNECITYLCVIKKFEYALQMKLTMQSMNKN